MLKILSVLILTFSFIIPTSTYARCAVCYTSGLSGASIAVLVIFFSAIFLFLANKLLHKLLEKDKA